MRRMPTRAFSERHRMLMRSMAVLVVMALAVLCCPATAVQAQAAPEASEGVLKKGGKTGGAMLGANVGHSNVKTVTFSNTKPTNTDAEKCWNASEGGGESVKGCATNNGDGTWDVVYGADGQYPTFPADSSGLFHGWSSLVSIFGLNYVDTSRVTDMAGMFQDCRSLTSLDLSNFKTSKVTDMNSMFNGCKSLTSLDLSRFDTSKVTDMRLMFRGCRSLTSLNLSNFNTHKVTDMSYMFADCENLSSLNVSSFNTSNMQSMNDMFSGCGSLATLDLSSFNTANVTDFEDAFKGLSGLERLVLGPGFTLPLGKLGLGAPHSPDRQGQRPTHKWWDGSAGMGYDPSQIPALRFRTITYEAGYVATTYRYKVIFNRNDGTGATTEQLFTSGDTKRLQKNGFTRTDYRFTGWNTQFNGRGESYRDEQHVKDLGKYSGAVVTLYAQWEPIPKKPTVKHTVQFDTHGGGTVSSQQVTSGTKAFKPGDPRRPGYTFAGWTTDAAGKWRYNFDSLVRSSITLHAQWKPIPHLKRLGGLDRYETMSKVIREAYPQTVNTVIVASGENYPDALAASGLAGVLNAPIVLTAPSSLSPQAAAELTRLKPSRIIIAGGPQAVSKHVQWQLGKYARVVERHGGADRYETSYLLYLRGKGLWKATAIVATGEEYADALSVSSYAYRGKAPVFLSSPYTGLSRNQRAALRGFGRVAVVGGYTAVPPRHTNGLPGCIRLGGADRYETSVSFAQWALRNGLGMNGVVFARGNNFPDALVAGPLAGRNGAVILLVESRYSASVRYARYQFAGKVSIAYVVGGAQAVNTDTASAIATALKVRQL